MLGAECSSCCDGWYCDGLQCYRCNLTYFPPTCDHVWDTTCKTQYGCKTMYATSPCKTVACTASVSGFGDVEKDACFNQVGLQGFSVTTFSGCNGTYSLQELCGGSSFYEQVQKRNSLPLISNTISHYGTFVFFQAGLTTQLQNGSAIAPAGYVALRVKLETRVQWLEDSTFVNFDLAGNYESDLIQIDSLADNGSSWLAGRSANLSMEGTYYTPSSLRCTLLPQSVTVSFS